MVTQLRASFRLGDKCGSYGFSKTWQWSKTEALCQVGETNLKEEAQSRSLDTKN